MFASASGKVHAINLTKDVVRLLGMPPYVCLKVNKVMDSFIVMPGKQKEYMSFKVPERFVTDKDVNMRMISKSFIKEFMAVNELDVTKSYRVEGIYSERNNAVIFNMADCNLYRGSVEK